MKKYVFIGASDKTDMLLYVSKLLTLLNKKVILIDTTILKKSRYIIPTMVKDKQYITNFEGIDVAIGFESYDAIEKYQKDHLGEITRYDIAIYDIDRPIAYQKFAIAKDDKHYFVTSFDVYSLKRGVQILEYIQKNAEVTKIYFTKDMIQEEDDYINFLAKDYLINWNQENIIFFPVETEIQNAIYVNQRSERILMKGLSGSYTDSILFLTEEMTGEKGGKLKKLLRKLE